MHSILHNVYIQEKDPSLIFDAMTTPSGLDRWWTLESAGKPILHSDYRFYFSEAFDWRATVTLVEIAKSIDWKMTEADIDWTGTSFGFRLKTLSDKTLVEFYHKDWKKTNEHFRRTSFCWAMYLYLLKRYLEYGEIIPFSDRRFT